MKLVSLLKRCSLDIAILSIFVFASTAFAATYLLSENKDVKITGGELYVEDTITTDGSVDLNTSGDTLILEDGTASTSCVGTVTANGTTEVPVTTTCAETGDYIFFSAAAAAVQSSACWAHQISDGVDFDFDCDAANTTVYNWWIIKGQ